MKIIRLLPVTMVVFSLCFMAWQQKGYSRTSDEVIINIPTSNGGFTPVRLTKHGTGYIGPQGEYYEGNPTVRQLEVLYGNGPSIQVSPKTIVITIAPPPIPIYVRPEPPAPYYIWIPGYWAYNFFTGYYWVPGTWVEAPAVGLVWTPGYWHWREGHFVWIEGYWGHHVGFYGGINYGFGYEGHGYRGGEWHNNVYVNKTVNITNITNNTTIINNTTSFNGGPGGVSATPTSAELAVAKERHIQPTAAQVHHVQMANNDPVLRVSVNQGKPAIAATIKPAVFSGKGVVAAKQAGAGPNIVKKSMITPTQTLKLTKHIMVNKPAGTMLSAKAGPTAKHLVPQKEKLEAARKAAAAKKKAEEKATEEKAATEKPSEEKAAEQQTVIR